MAYSPWTVDHEPWTVDCGPWTVDCNYEDHPARALRVGCSSHGGPARLERRGRFVERLYFLGRTASFSCLAMRAFTTVFAGILMASPVAGLRPMRALRF